MQSLTPEQWADIDAQIFSGYLPESSKFARLAALD